MKILRKFVEKLMELLFPKTSLVLDRFPWIILWILALNLLMPLLLQFL